MVTTKIMYFGNLQRKFLLTNESNYIYALERRCHMGEHGQATVHCRNVVKRLSGYVDGEIMSELSENIHRHLQECPQ